MVELAAAPRPASRLKALKAFLPRKTARWLLTYGRLPFGPQFDRRVFRSIMTAENGDLQRIRGLDESQHSAWKGLGHVGYGLVEQFRPKVIVELGTHMGFSALAMGKALQKNGEGGKLYAVDTWEGDPQAGHYDDSVYRTFLKRIDELGLQTTITPLRMLFDEARDKVATPIDILHIDGLHTWDAVKHDWDTFSPLVRPGGLVLFHDVHSPWVDVTRFWETLQPRYRTFTVPLSFGLGILQIPEAKQ